MINLKASGFLPFIFWVFATSGFCADIPDSSDIAAKLATPTPLPSQEQFQSRSIFGPSTSRGITVTNATPDELPSINLNILFEFDSSKLSPEGSVLVGNLGRALKDKRLVNNRFRLEGHTDGKGSDSYNQSLSERRAESVRRELISIHGIEPYRLEALGFGKKLLVDPTNPESSANRRVKVINLGS